MTKAADPLEAYMAEFHGDLPPHAQAALLALIRTSLAAGMDGGRSPDVQLALDAYLDAAGGAALKTEPARTYVQHFLDHVHRVAARYFYAHGVKALSGQDRDALKALVADRFDLEAWSFQADLSRR